MSMRWSGCGPQAQKAAVALDLVARGWSVSAVADGIGMKHAALCATSENLLLTPGQLRPCVPQHVGVHVLPYHPLEIVSRNVGPGGASMLSER